MSPIKLQLHKDNKETVLFHQDKRQCLTISDMSVITIPESHNDNVRLPDLKLTQLKSY
jgi:hypothetical protein